MGFNSQYPKLTEQTHRVAIVRGEAGKMALDAGYTDAKGKYVQQVSVPFDVDTGDSGLISTSIPRPTWCSSTARR